MNLNSKKELAKRTLGVGKEKIIFLPSKIKEINEAITKQDIRDLYKEGAITIKRKKGMRKKEKRKTKKGEGKIKKKVKKRKKEYMIITRKLRKIVSGLKKHGKISDKEVNELRINSTETLIELKPRN